jgi:hypothetical protein
MLRHRTGKVCPDLAMRPLSTRPRGPSQRGKIYIGVQRLGKTDKRPFCRCRGMGQWDYWRELLLIWCHSPFAQSTPHILNFKLPVEMSPQPQVLQDGFLHP